MTDEEIEKALYENYDKTITEWLDCYGVYSYIKQLKEKIRKDTAKEICALLEEQERQGKAVLPKGFLFTARKAYDVEEIKE